MMKIHGPEPHDRSPNASPLQSPANMAKLGWLDTAGVVDEAGIVPVWLVRIFRFFVPTCSNCCAGTDPRAVADDILRARRV